MQTYTVPKYFYSSLAAVYCLHSNAVLKENAHTILLNLTDEERDQLLLDAQYYARTFDGHRNRHLRTLASSAAATIRALTTPRA